MKNLDLSDRTIEVAPVRVHDPLPQLVARTPNPECPACCAYRLHNDEEWREFHP